MGKYQVIKSFADGHRLIGAITETKTEAKKVETTKVEATKVIEKKVIEKK
jgi:hypothetical protein